MKALRVFGSFLFSILLCLGIGMFAAHKACEHIAVDTLANTMMEQINGDVLAQAIGLDDVLTSEMKQQIETQVQNKAEDIKDILKDNSTLQSISDEYVDALLAGLGGGTAELPDVKADMESIAKEVLPQVAQSAGLSMSENQASSLAKVINEHVDVQGTLEKAVEKVQSTMSGPQKQIISMASFAKQGSTNLLAYVLIIGSAIAIGLLTFSPYKWLPYVGVSCLASGGILVAGAKVGGMLLGGSLKQEMLTSIVKQAMDSLFTTGLWTCGIGIIVLIIYGVIQFLRNHLVYE